MKNRVVFDLDGVLRNLAGGLSKKFKIPYPKNWRWEAIREIDKNPSLIDDFPPMPYLDIIKDYFKEIDIWTNQPKNWRPYTEKWLETFLKNRVKSVVYVNSFIEKENLLKENKDVILVEDCPKFKNYERIILIDQPYNQDIKNCRRIKNPIELDRFFGKVGLRNGN